jgi:hypothetical protein
MPAAQRERLDSLHEKQQRQPLTTEERTEEQALLALYRETLLVRWASSHSPAPAWL